MKLNPELAEALNRQINSELSASHAYLAMAAYFETQDLPGFGQWFRAQSAEEVTHAMRLFDFMAKRGGRIEMAGIDQPKSDFASPADALETALSNEEAVTAQINALFALAHEVKDYGTQNMLNWFVEEQTEEEDLFGQILDRTKAANDDRWNLLLLDQEMGARGAEPPAEA